MGCSRTHTVTFNLLYRSNNTNKWDAQERVDHTIPSHPDQIIPINGMLKNAFLHASTQCSDQIIPINGMLKNTSLCLFDIVLDQIIPINGMLKNVRFLLMLIVYDQIIPINGMLKNIVRNAR